MQWFFLWMYSRLAVLHHLVLFISANANSFSSELVSSKASINRLAILEAQECFL